MMKYFCDNCGAVLPGPAVKDIKAATAPGSLSDTIPGVPGRGSEPAPVQAKITVDGEFCDTCKERIVLNLRPDWVLARANIRKIGG